MSWTCSPPGFGLAKRISRLVSHNRDRRGFEKRMLFSIHDPNGNTPADCRDGLSRQKHIHRNGLLRAVGFLLSSIRKSVHSSTIFLLGR